MPCVLGHYAIFYQKNAINYCKYGKCYISVSYMLITFVNC